jgi:small conductance mechanosensitive channel
MDDLATQVGQADKWLAHIKDLALAYAPKLAAALLVLWIGSMLIRLAGRVLGRVLQGRGVEPTLQRFVHNLAIITLRILLIVTVVGMLGVETTSFVAMVGAAGLAVGLALQGSLANFAGGALILFFKPYKVGDLVEAQGMTGEVKEIQMFTTVLLTPQSKTAIIPNGAMANGNIINYTREGKIRVDLTFGLNYGASLAQARHVLTEVMSAHPAVLRDPAPAVTIEKLNLEGVQLAVRPYCKPEDHWTVYFDVYERGLLALQAAGVAGPQASMKVVNTQG